MPRLLPGARLKFLGRRALVFSRRPASQLDLFQVFCPQDTTVKWKPVRRLIPRNFQFVSLFLCVPCLQFISDKRTVRFKVGQMMKQRLAENFKPPESK
jgi:hypothetical protein